MNISEQITSPETFVQWVAWHWEAEQQKSFQNLKMLVNKVQSSSILMRKGIQDCLTQALKFLGAVFVQDSEWLQGTDWQRRYTQIEKELLAIVCVCEKFKQCVWQDSACWNTPPTFRDWLRNRFTRLHQDSRGCWWDSNLMMCGNYKWRMDSSSTSKQLSRRGNWKLMRNCKCS